VDDFPDVLVRAQHGDEVAFTDLYRTMQPMLLRYLTVLAGPAAAEDLAAETWVAALRGLVKFRGNESDLRGWLITIARARWVDMVRALTRRPEELTDAPPEQRAPDDVASLVVERAASDEAIAMIAQLPEEQAEIVTLRVVAQLEVAEVAEITGKTANHVRVLCHRGLRRLAQLMPTAPVTPVMPALVTTMDEM
jgi:RNA polymerase sigma-70 factor (ECF subfamily)